VLDLLRRDGDSSNTVIGVILLVMLLVFIGPNILPTILSRTFEFVDEGVPCTRLRQAENRAMHQSLIGRSAVNPLDVRVIAENMPTDPNDPLTIRIVIENQTIGSIPIVFDERQILVGDDGVSSGFGLIFSPAVSLRTTGTRQAAGGVIAESSIRMLGPRQRCVHRVDFANASLDPQIASGTTTVQAYYRITTAGTLSGGVYPDQGLAIIQGGFLLSQATAILPPQIVAPAQ
jgi:hypothetical protein